MRGLSDVYIMYSLSRQFAQGPVLGGRLTDRLLFLPLPPASMNLLIGIEGWLTISFFYLLQ